MRPFRREAAPCLPAAFHSVRHCSGWTFHPGGEVFRQRLPGFTTWPEGGFAEFEADMARKLGMHICSMGERILRCETAPVVALTALMYSTGNL